MNEERYIVRIVNSHAGNFPGNCTFFYNTITSAKSAYIALKDAIEEFVGDGQVYLLNANGEIILSYEVNK